MASLSASNCGNKRRERGKEEERKEGGKEEERESERERGGEGGRERSEHESSLLSVGFFPTAESICLSAINKTKRRIKSCGLLSVHALTS